MNLLGIDFEDWYHPELIQHHISKKNHTPTVVNGIDKILELLRKNDTYATFFIVGELLEFRPELLDKVLQNGHEVAFHTMHHTRLDSFESKEQFLDELKEFAKLTSGKSKGFRAPTFSLNYTTSWIIDILTSNGYLYDSSIVPTKTSMYGIQNADIKPYKITKTSLEKNDPAGLLTEFPLLITKIIGKKIPAGGGFYLRLLPLKITKTAIQNYEKMGIPATFYVHSWELTPEYMKKVPLPFKDNFITYHNLKKTYSKMEQLLKNFKFTSFDRYMSKIN